MSAVGDRRNFFKLTSLLVGGLPALGAAGGAMGAVAADAAAATPPPRADDHALAWLDGAAPEAFEGVTWGVPWPRGEVAAASGFVLRARGAGADAGTAAAAAAAGAPLQSWPLAYWPDGSLKWTGHALPPSAAGAPPAAAYTLEPVPALKAASASAPAMPALVTRNGADIVIDTGAMHCTLAGSGALLVRAMRRRGEPLLRDGRLVLLVDGPEQAEDEAAGASRQRYEGVIDTVTIEQAGPQRAVIKAVGSHRRADGASLLPFVVRLYFYRDSANVRLVHSLVYDADPATSFIRGIGLRFDVPLAKHAPHDRHVRFVGDNGGVFAEAVRGLTGLRRDPGAAIVGAQLAGRATPPLTAFPAPVAAGLRYIPAFGDYSLLQAHPDGFSISKRTAAGSGWIHAASGTRAAGVGYLGTPDGGVAFGVRNFWQSYPGQIDIKGAAGDSASVTLWLWAPRAPAMDLRFYHDGMGQADYTAQRDGLDITYEDYEPGFGTPFGAARTSELHIELLAATPDAARLAAISRRIQTPPQLLAPSARLNKAGVFSEYWRPADATAGPAAARLQAKLAWTFDYYRDQVAERKWYGFWDFGDVMHTYDAQRHVWRYDVGGFAWDNSELSTEIWLWHYFLHSGRADAYRMAEAMTRHTSEVDVHHIGPYAPLGSRHNVQHWGDSAKQLRVSTVTNRRFLYYLSADERIGDLLRDQVDAVDRLRQIIPGRKIGQVPPANAPDTHASVGFGTDWGAISAAWFTEWERTNAPKYRDKLLTSMATIAAQPHGFFTGVADMDLHSGAFTIDTTGEMTVSHLSAVFGLAEVCSELVRCLPEQGVFRDAWLQYCRLYSASPAEQEAALGKSFPKLNLSQGHARLLAYAGVWQHDATLRTRAWKQFFAGRAGITYADLASRRVSPPQVLSEIDEAPTLSTNAVAQWGLGALGMLALAPGDLPEQA